MDWRHSNTKINTITYLVQLTSGIIWINTDQLINFYMTDTIDEGINH